MTKPSMPTDTGKGGEPRPRQLTPDMANEAALEIARELAEGRHIDEREISDCARDIAREGTLYGDGYSLAKRLDDDCGWDCNLFMAEILDGFSTSARSMIEAAQKTWATENAIEPPLAIGTPIRLVNTGETGVIDGVYKHGAAQFTVKIDGDLQSAAPTNSRRIVDFENVAALSRAEQVPHE